MSNLKQDVTQLLGSLKEHTGTARANPLLQFITDVDSSIQDVEEKLKNTDLNEDEIKKSLVRLLNNLDTLTKRGERISSVINELERSKLATNKIIGTM